MSGLSTDRVLQLAHALRAAAAVMAALELGVFTELGKGPRTRAQLQRRLGLSGPGLADHLDALVGLGWLEREGDDGHAVYVNTRESAHFMDRRSPAFLGQLLCGEQTVLFGGPSRSAAMLRGMQSPEAAAQGLALAQARAARAAWHADALMARFDLRPVARLLDVRGAAGALACRLATAQPHLACSTLEDPRRVQEAAVRIRLAGLEHRVQVLALAAPRTPAPWPPCNAVLIDLALGAPGLARRGQWLRGARAALSGGGVLILVCHLVDGLRRHAAAATLLRVQAQRLAGEAPLVCSEQVLRAECLAAGFARVEHRALADGLSALLAWRTA